MKRKNKSKRGMENKNKNSKKPNDQGVSSHPTKSPDPIEIKKDQAITPIVTKT